MLLFVCVFFKSLITRPFAVFLYNSSTKPAIYIYHWNTPLLSSHHNDLRSELFTLPSLLLLTTRLPYHCRQDSNHHHSRWLPPPMIDSPPPTAQHTSDANARRHKGNRDSDTRFQTSPNISSRIKWQPGRQAAFTATPHPLVGGLLYPRDHSGP